MNADVTPRSEVELRAIVSVLRRQRRVIIYTFAAVLSAAALFIALVPPRYTATALVYVDPQSRNALGAQGRATPGTENARIDSEVEILRSEAVALAVITRASLEADPEFGPRSAMAERLARAIGIANAAQAPQAEATTRTLARFLRSVSVRRKGLTYLILVSMTSQSPERAAELANALTEAYIDQQVQTKIRDNLVARDAVGKRISAARERLAAYEAAFDGLIARYSGAADTPSPVFAGLQQELEEISGRYDLEAQRFAAAAELRASGDWPALAGMLQDEALRSLQNERQAVVSALNASAASGEGEGLRTELSRLDEEISSRASSALAALNERRGLLERKASDLRRQIRGELMTAQLSAEELTEIFSLQQEASIARAQYQELLSRMRDLETRAELQIADSTVVSPALAPVAPAFPNKSLVLLAALSLALGTGVGLAFLNEYYVGGITSAGQLAELAQEPPAASIPLTSEANSGRQSPADRVIDAPLSDFSESVRKLRAALDQSFRKAQAAAQPATAPAPGRIVLITSALPGEGKTTTALALARTYAQTGRKTLLIDADLRRPMLHRHLGLQPKTGLLDYLRHPDDTSISDGFYVRDVVSPLAMILGAGRSEYATDQLLTSVRFETLLAQAREVYDVTVIDTSPLLPVVDARYIAPQADAVAVAVKWAATSQRDLRGALQIIRGAVAPGTPVLPVLTQTRSGEGRGGYSGYDGYSAAI